MPEMSEKKEGCLLIIVDDTTPHNVPCVGFLCTFLNLLIMRHRGTCFPE